MLRIKKVFASVRDDLANGENLDAYVLFVLGVTFALLGIFGFVDFNVLGAVILMALSLLVIGDVVSRHSNRDLRKVLVASLQTNASSPLKTFTVKYETLAPRISAAQTVMLLGTSLQQSIPVLRDRLAQALMAGGKLRVILANPDNDSILQMTAFITEDGGSAKTHKQRILSSIDELRTLRGQCPGADVQLRIIDSIPLYGMTLIIPKDDSSSIWCHVRLRGFRKAVAESPVINPDAILHVDLIQYYFEQFELMWAAGAEVPLDNAK